MSKYRLNEKEVKVLCVHNKAAVHLNSFKEGLEVESKRLIPILEEKDTLIAQYEAKAMRANGEMGVMILLLRECRTLLEEHKERGYLNMGKRDVLLDKLKEI